MFTVHNQELHMTDFYSFIFTKFSSTYAAAFKITAFGPRIERQVHDYAKIIFQHLGARAREILSQVADLCAPLRWHYTNLSIP